MGLTTDKMVRRFNWAFQLRFSVLAGGGCFFVGGVSGQEALRLSLADEATAQSRQQAAASIGYYNLLAGPTAWRYSAGLGLEYDDNVFLRKDNRQGDFIFRPNVDTRMHWPVTEKNSLDVSITGGYSYYTHNHDFDQFYIYPDSGLSFDIYAGDFAINLHDRVSITENGYQNPGANGNNIRLENAAGPSIVWDLGTVVSSLDYEHANYIGLNSNQQPDGTSENALATLGVRVLPKLLVGAEAGGGKVNYDQSNGFFSPNGKQWNTGGFFRAQMSQHINAKFDAGYTTFLPQALSDTDGYYFQLSVSHRVNRFLNYTLSASRATDFQFYGQPYRYYSVEFEPNWNVLKKFKVSTPFWWRKGTPVYNPTANFDQFGVGINVGRALTQKLSANVYYRFVEETSNQLNLNYTDNIAGLNLAYQF